ncbi:DUF1416 domain-containing protein [Nakamurella flavida]|uniref:DUF1416 domain-containing protein n=1 Tax=Nakamurella flavida TaxID=363630 RepID=A0A939C430_9ACTN|nr:DUF1416 domain-containing protein [Nakamurella flavida]MBM9477661.1 DUF1416 domain-containing protein [Nakamurella flavida]MDP9779212.1 hypothetical protein [Nakamurella flavida]
MCGAPEQTLDLPPGTNTVDQAVLQGKVLHGADPVGGAFVRLLDGTGEFTAEVVSSPAGDFRFYAAPGSWTVRALSRSGNGQASVTTATGVYSVDVVLD